MTQVYPTFSCAAERVWHAWQCLPRDGRGAPPSLRSLEERHQIAHGSLNKLIEGRAKLERTNHERSVRIAAALGVDLDWLLYGRGAPPQTAWSIPRWPGPKKRTKSGTMPAVTMTKRTS